MCRMTCNCKGYSKILRQTSATCNMGSSLRNADIHEFLACLGKHAVAKATQGFSSLRNEEPECSKMVFVEDTDELSQFDNRSGSLDREHKGDAFSEWRKSTRDSVAGWGGKKDVTTHEWKKQVSVKGNSGWEDETKVSPTGWETSMQKESNFGWGEHSPGGWGKSSQQDENDGWGEEKKVGSGEITHKKNTRDGWGSNTQKNINSGGGEVKRVTSAGWGDEREVNPGGWKTSTPNESNSGWGDEREVNPGGWETSTPNESNSGWGEDCPGGWGKSTRQDEKSGWGEEKDVGSGETTQKEDTYNGWGGSTQKNINSGWGEEKPVTAGGRGEEKAVSGGGWEEKENCFNGWDNGKQKEDTDTGWGSNTRKEGNTGCIGWENNTQKGGNSGWGDKSQVAGDEWGKGKEVTHGGWRKGTPKQDTGIGWGGRSTQMENNTGWGEENEVTGGRWGKDKRVASGGWGRSTPKKDTGMGWSSSTQEGNARCRGWEKGIQKEDIRTGWRNSRLKEGNREWGKENRDLAGGWGKEKKFSGGWGKCTPEENACDGWESCTQKKGDVGWGEDGKVLADGWGVEKTFTSKRDACNEWGSSTQKVGDARWGEDNQALVDGWEGEKSVGWGKGPPKIDACNKLGSSTEKEDDSGWRDDGLGGERTIGWGKGTSEKVAFTGGRSSTQKEGDAAWGKDNDALADGWGEERALGCGEGTPKFNVCIGGESNPQEASANGGEEIGVTADDWVNKEKVAFGRWGKGIKDRDAFIGWQSSTQTDNDTGWGQEKTVTAGGWGEENKVSADDRVECVQKKDACIGKESNKQNEGNVGWGEEEDGGWGQKLDQEVHNGWGEKEEDTGWGKKNESVCCGWETNIQDEDNSGWGSALNDPNCEERNKNALSDSGQDPNWASKQKVVTGDESGWNCTLESDTWKTAPDAADGWGQRARYKPKKGWSRNPTGIDSAENCNADKRRTGTFGPSGTNAVPLGKRKSILKGSNGDAENGHGQSDGPERSGWNSKTEHEAMAEADSSGGRSELPVGKNLKMDGWNDTKSDEDATPRPSKKHNQSFNANSWVASVSNNQNRRPRLKALINLPECSELNSLYKATNKILHYNGYQSGDKLNPEDEKFILEEVLVHHREKDVKLGCGVDYVMIDSHADHQVSCFWVVRKDGSKTDFSYWKCLENLFELKYSHVATKEVSEEASKGYWGRGMKSAAIKQQFSQEPERKDTKEDINDGW